MISLPPAVCRGEDRWPASAGGGKSDRSGRAAQPVVGQGLPGVDTGAVSAVKVGLQAFATLQFDIRDDKIQLKPSLVAMLYPQTGVLVTIEAGQQRVLHSSIRRDFSASAMSGS